MLTFLQILIVLFIIALIAIVLGFFIGKIACTRQEGYHYEQKGKLCEEKFLAKLGEEELEAKEKTITQEKTQEEISQEKLLQEESKESLQTFNESKSEKKEENKSQEEKDTIEQNLPQEILSKEKTGLIEGKEPDNLTLIKGIGMVIAKQLNDLGVYYFEQIAIWEEEDIAKVDQYLAFKGRIKREKWVEQAKDLVKGIESEFAKRVKEGKVPSSKA